jgi:1,4-alpha-glucan branching enzyme
VWAPNAKKVSVIGNFNDWNNNAHPLEPRSGGYLGGIHPRHREGLAISSTSCLSSTNTSATKPTLRHTA